MERLSDDSMDISMDSLTLSCLFCIVLERKEEEVGFSKDLVSFLLESTELIGQLDTITLAVEGKVLVSRRLFLSALFWWVLVKTWGEIKDESIGWTSKAEDENDKDDEVEEIDEDDDDDKDVGDNEAIVACKGTFEEVIKEVSSSKDVEKHVSLDLGTIFDILGEQAGSKELGLIEWSWLIFPKFET